jgi:hypothetical protein
MYDISVEGTVTPPIREFIARTATTRPDELGRR